MYPYIQAAAEEYYATGMPIMRHHLLTDPDDARAHGRDDQYLFGPDILVAPVLERGRHRALALPARGRLGRVVAIGGLCRGHAAASHSARRACTPASAEVVVDAPRDEIPLFVRAGAVIPLLAPDVYTLAEHGADDPSIVRLADRADQLHLLAFPRGASSGSVFRHRPLHQHRVRRMRWTLSIDDSAARTVHLQAALGSAGATLHAVFGERRQGSALDAVGLAF